MRELLKACATGEMPQVTVISSGTYLSPIGTVGQVTVIKNNGRHNGIGCQFKATDFDQWFHDDPDGTDKRKCYMHQLEVINQ